jgi:trigger factor
MPNIVRKEIAPLTETITLVLTKEEVQSKFKSELQRFKNKASIKGFRQGKAPDSFVKKMYGQNMLIDIVNNMMQKSIGEYLETEKLDILGQPIPSENSPKIFFNPDNISDFEFHFDIGMSPTFEIKGLDKSTNITKFVPEITEEIVEESIENFLAQNAVMQSVEGEVKMNDRLTLEAKSADGSIEKEFSVLVNDMPDEARAEFLNLKKGESITWDIYDLETGKDKAFVNKYVLGMDEAAEVAPTFSLNIKDINRSAPRVFNEDTVQEIFGGEASTVEEAKQFIKNDMKANYANHGMALCFRDLQDTILAQNELPLPDEFMKRWLKVSSDKNTDEIVERDYARFSSNLRWTLIRDKVIADNNIQLEKTELLAAFKAKVARMFGGNAQGIDDAMLTNIAESFMNNPKSEKEVQETAEEIMFDKVFNQMASQVSVVEQEVSMEDFLEMNRVAREQAQEIRSGSTELQENMEGGEYEEEA